MDTFSIKLLKIIFLLAKTTRYQIEKTHFDKMMDYIDKEEKKKKKLYHREITGHIHGLHVVIIFKSPISEEGTYLAHTNKKQTAKEKWVRCLRRQWEHLDQFFTDSLMGFPPNAPFPFPLLSKVILSQFTHSHFFFFW